MLSMRKIAKIIKNRQNWPQMAKIAKKWLIIAKNLQRSHFQIKLDICENWLHFCPNLIFSWTAQKKEAIFYIKWLKQFPTDFSNFFFGNQPKLTVATFHSNKPTPFRRSYISYIYIYIYIGKLPLLWYKSIQILQLEFCSHFQNHFFSTFRTILK